MTLARLALASLAYYRRTHAAVALGVAGAVAVLAGSLLVGASVRDSLASIAASRLGRTDIVIGAEQPFTEALALRLHDALDFPVAPMFALEGIARHESSSRRAGNVSVYGIDARFFEFHGVAAVPLERSDALLSADLAEELGASDGDAVVIRIARPTDIPLDSLHGRREDIGRSMRLTMRGRLGREAMGEFALAPAQGPARAVFIPLARLQRDLELPERVNTLLVGGGSSAASGVRAALSAVLGPDDLGLRIERPGDGSTAIVEASSGLVSDTLAGAIERIAARGPVSVTPVLTWLATRMTVRDRTVPYSLVTALGGDAAGDERMARALGAPPDAAPSSAPPLVLNAWAARELRASSGDPIEIEYYRWADEGRLVTERAAFRVAGVVPMDGLAVDRRLAPAYPGITTASSLSDWDPPFPIDLGLVRPEDEDYWDRYRTAPKAFVSLADGQRLWRTRHGQLTSFRIRAVDGAPPDERFLSAVAREVNPAAAGIRVVDVRAQAGAASAGTTDFGAYFSYFSFFLMLSALLLSALFFRLSVEQRLTQIGVLRAAGFSLAAIRRALMLEGSVVAIAGALAGVLLAVGWAALMMLALRTWWVDAVGTTLLELHVDPSSLAIGALGALLAAVLSIAVTVRGLAHQTPRAMLTGATSTNIRRHGGRAMLLAVAAFGVAGILSALSLFGVMPAAAGFFGSGALVLVGGLAAFRRWLAGAGGREAGETRGLTSLASLGVRNAAWRPGRSLTAAGLVAAAVFLLVSVDSFRKTAGATGSVSSGTGGFALIAESELPIVHDLQTPAGRDAVGLPAAASDASIAGVDLYSLRLRPGDDASCLNLYQPKQPRVVGIPDRLGREGRFRFARVIDAADEAARANPWTLLGPPDSAGVVPAIVDQTSLQYVLHAGVGDVITIDADTSRPVDLRIVASLDDSVLQGEILIGELAFRQLFPDVAGYRVFLVTIAPGSGARADEVARTLEGALEPFGFDAQDTGRKLEAYHRVENTYLSTFQALGGLGLVLGCLGLVAVIARNVLERRRELALLGAAGFTGRDLQRVVAIEHVALVGIGLLIGVVAAGVAIAPVVVSRSGTAPWHALVWLVPVAAAGFAAAYGATRSLKRMPLVASLRSE